MIYLPDQEARMKEVTQLAEEARTNAAQPTPVELPKSESATRVFPDAVAAPIYMGKTTDLIPEHYVLHYSETHCANCGTTSRRSQLFALNYIRSRTGASRVKNLTPCDRPLYNLPVQRLYTGAHRVAYCCECQEIDLSHLPPPPSPAQLHDLPDARLKGAPAPKDKTPKTEPKSKKATLEDLI